MDFDLEESQSLRSLRNAHRSRIREIIHMIRIDNGRIHRTGVTDQQRSIA